MSRRRQRCHRLQARQEGRNHQVPTKSRHDRYSNPNAWLSIALRKEDSWWPERIALLGKRTRARPPVPKGHPLPPNNLSSSFSTDCTAFAVFGSEQCPKRGSRPGSRGKVCAAGALATARIGVRLLAPAPAVPGSRTINPSGWRLDLCIIKDYRYTKARLSFCAIMYCTALSYRERAKETRTTSADEETKMSAVLKSIEDRFLLPVEDQDPFGDASGEYRASGCWREERYPRTWPSRIKADPGSIENPFGDL